MGRYINFLVKNDFHECLDHEKAKVYATKACEKLNEAWKKMPYADGGEGYVTEYDGYCDYIEVEFDSYSPWSFWMSLRDGYWAVETCMNDYMINNYVYDVASEVYIVPLQCRMICEALGEPEAWICFEDRLNNSPDAPYELKDWLEYAEKVGVKDVTFEDFKQYRIEPDADIKEEKKRLINYNWDEYDSGRGISYHILYFISK